MLTGKLNVPDEEAILAFVNPPAKESKVVEALTKMPTKTVFPDVKPQHRPITPIVEEQASLSMNQSIGDESVEGVSPTKKIPLQIDKLA